MESKKFSWYLPFSILIMGLLIFGLLVPMPKDQPAPKPTIVPLSNGIEIKENSPRWVTKNQGCIAMITSTFQLYEAIAGAFLEANNPDYPEDVRESYKKILLKILERNEKSYQMIKPDVEVAVRETKKGLHGSVVRIWEESSKLKEEELWTDARCLGQK